MFDWDTNNLRKLGRTGSRLKKWRKRCRTTRSRSTTKMWRGKCATSTMARQIRLLAVVLVERCETIRVVTAYDLDAGQKKDYFARRLRGE